MRTVILLFRGINVGGHRRLPMKDLQSLLADLGCDPVRTYIQSGNAVVRAAEISPDEVADEIDRRHGFRPEVLVLDPEDLRKAVAANPFDAEDGTRVHFYFCADRPAPVEARLDELLACDEAFTMHERILYLHAPSGIGRSRLVANLEGCLGVSATGRNLRTVEKLLALAGEVDAA